MHLIHNVKSIYKIATTGDWLWPAIWLLPTDGEYGADWPSSGEIDLVESRGNKNLKHNGNTIGVDSMGSTLHWGTSYFTNQYPRTHATRFDSFFYHCMSVD